MLSTVSGTVNSVRLLILNAPSPMLVTLSMDMLDRALEAKHR